LHLISWLFNCSYKVKLIIPNVATKIKLIIGNVATNPPTKQGTKEKATPPQPTNRKGIARANQPSPTPPPKPSQQRNGSKCKKPKKRGTHCKKTETPKKKIYFFILGYPQRATDVEVECL
jgi:hypothetical protein